MIIALRAKKQYVKYDKMRKIKISTTYKEEK